MAGVSVDQVPEQMSIYDYLPDTVEYVCRSRSGGFLVYHDARCRHVRGRPDVQAVTPDEVRAAVLSNHARVRYRGRTVLLWPCRRCLPPLRDWPWTT